MGLYTSVVVETQTSRHRLATLRSRIGSLVRAINEGDEAQIEAAILRLSQSRRVFAPLGLAVGAFVMLFQGVKLLVSNWRLTLVEVIPAMWIWLVMYDLKAHVLRGGSARDIRGAVLIPLTLLIVVITVASFFLNAVFAFAISQQGPPQIRQAFEQARRHLTPIVVSGSVVGLILAFTTLVVSRWSRPWFVLCLGVVVGVMMICYVAVPVAAGRSQADPVEARQALGDGHRRSVECDRVHASLHPRAHRPADARIEAAADTGNLRLRRRDHASGRRDRSGQSDQDERQPQSAPSSERIAIGWGAAAFVGSPWSAHRHPDSN